ncbi:hypothetical protein B0H11DRAFT_2224831 [Mycena galericulata]|nr:hypothetical protein B0H11DRAFT_2224831 [Mycena galericulata]
MPLRIVGDSCDCAALLNPSEYLVSHICFYLPRDDNANHDPISQANVPTIPVLMTRATLATTTIAAAVVAEGAVEAVTMTTVVAAAVVAGDATMIVVGVTMTAGGGMTIVAAYKASKLSKITFSTPRLLEPLITYDLTGSLVEGLETAVESGTPFPSKLFFFLYRRQARCALISASGVAAVPRSIPPVFPAPGLPPPAPPSSDRDREAQRTRRRETPTTLPAGVRSSVGALLVALSARTGGVCSPRSVGPSHASLYSPRER